jgi:tRNA nucleotidyltransferase (CCA-adding enzyme)
VYSATDYAGIHGLANGRSARLPTALAAYAASRGGRYLLYGSAARGTMRHDSDVDILADFPPEAIDDAWVFAEEARWRDRRPLAYSYLIIYSSSTEA